MPQAQKILTSLLSEFTRAIGRLSDEQLHRLVTGDGQLSITVRRNTAQKDRKRSIATVEFREDFRALYDKFCGAKSAEECAVMVEYLLPNKEEMFAFAKYLRLSVQHKDGQGRLRDKIVDATVGTRIRNEMRSNFPELRDKFRAAKSVEECAVLVQNAFPNKEEMFDFAKHIHLPVQRKDGQKRIRDQIVNATAGSRLRSEIIRGGY